MFRSSDFGQIIEGNKKVNRFIVELIYVISGFDNEKEDRYRALCNQPKVAKELRRLIRQQGTQS